MILKDKIAVVTGVSKGIGEALCRQLLSNGSKVYGLGRNDFDGNHTNYTFIKTDVRNLEDLTHVIDAEKPDIIFHLAAKSHPFYSFSNPIETVRTNVLGTINILEACKKLNIHSKIIFSNLTSKLSKANRNFQMMIISISKITIYK
jgi:nucleoside-diphosphate-sugar epimerase